MVMKASFLFQSRGDDAEGDPERAPRGHEVSFDSQ